MRKIFLFFILFISSFTGLTQNFHLLGSDSLGLIHSNHSIMFFHDSNSNKFKVSEKIFNFKSSSRYAMYYNSYYSRSMIYDTYRNEYVIEDFLIPYNNFESAVIGGVLNTIISLFYKKE